MCVASRRIKVLATVSGVNIPAARYRNVFFANVITRNVHWVVFFFFFPPSVFNKNPTTVHLPHSPSLYLCLSLLYLSLSSSLSLSVPRRTFSALPFETDSMEIDEYTRMYRSRGHICKIISYSRGRANSAGVIGRFKSRVESRAS